MMKDQNHSIKLYLAVPFLLCAVAVALTGMRTNAQAFGECSGTMDVAAPATITYTVCLPLLHKHGPPRAKLGVDFGLWATVTETIAYDYPVAKEMGAQWMRVFVSWLEVETAPGEYHWGKYDPVFERLAELEFDALVVIYAAPDWASELSCGPITDTLALENFLEALVPRYADVVDAWEFINEPDGREPYHYGPIIGCWGLDPAEYARQLGLFYRKIKLLDPGALVFFGGLAYDNFDHFERDFFDQALQNGASPFFDGVSLHHYPINPGIFPTMAHKVNEISEAMARNGVHGKKIWVTETGMWINDVGYEPLNGSEELQRDFIVREFARGFGAGVDGIFWFDPREHTVWEGAVQRWLISTDHQPIYGYDTFQHLAEKLEGMHCYGAYDDVPDEIEAYEFVGTQGLLYIMWSNTMTQTIALPSPADAIFTGRDGEESRVLPVQAGKVEFEVGEDPVFIEIPHSE